MAAYIRSYNALTLPDVTEIMSAFFLFFVCSRVSDLPIRTTREIWMWMFQNPVIVCLCRGSKWISVCCWGGALQAARDQHGEHRLSSSEKNKTNNDSAPEAAPGRSEALSSGPRQKFSQISAWKRLSHVFVSFRYWSARWQFSTATLLRLVSNVHFVILRRHYLFFSFSVCMGGRQWAAFLQVCSQYTRAAFFLPRVTRKVFRLVTSESHIYIDNQWSVWLGHFFSLR